MASPRKDDGKNSLGGKLDLDPRMAAAMKVTGIRETHIEAKPAPAEDLSGTSRERACTRHEFFERKRKKLLQELEMTADNLSDDDILTILSPKAREEVAATAELEALFAEEKDKVDKQKERMKAELQRELALEMEKKQALEADQRRTEEARRRAAEVEREKAEEFVRKQEERLKQEAKREEILKKAAAIEHQKRRDTAKMLAESTARATKLANEKVRERQQALEDRRRKIVDIAERNLQLQEALEEGLISKHNECLRKEMEQAGRVQQSNMAQAEKMQEKKGGFAEKMAYVQETQSQQAQERVKSRQQSIEKMNTARMHYKKHLEEVAEKTRQNREKEVAKFEANRQARRRERVEWLKEWKSRMAESNAKSVEVREKYMEDTVGKSMDTRAVFQDLFRENRERIEKSEECAREQTLAKIQAVQSKIDSKREQKQQLLEYRTSTLKEVMVGKAKLNELRVIIREKSSKKVNPILKQFDLPLLPSGASKDGEEGEPRS
mmetsp:Transcript_51007/g.110678  ORF Transcript_51007/g.110678 Transcript_51007/m.110678 type:complete len:496 (-) Transcript_51007:154-1641(-)